VLPLTTTIITKAVSLVMRVAVLPSFREETDRHTKVVVKGTPLSTAEAVHSMRAAVKNMVLLRTLRRLRMAVARATTMRHSILAERVGSSMKAQAGNMPPLIIALKPVRNMTVPMINTVAPLPTEELLRNIMRAVNSLPLLSTLEAVVTHNTLVVEAANRSTRRPAVNSTILLLTRVAGANRKAMGARSLMRTK